MLRPVADRISQAFGANPTFYQQYGLRGHEGVDFASPHGTLVKAADSGTVVFAGNGGNYGNYVEIQHSHGRTGYAHLSSIGVSLGQQVGAGTIIGKVGSTGLSTGPHLHFNYRTQSSNNGYLGGVDPMPYIKEDKMFNTQEEVDDAYLAILHRRANTIEEKKNWVGKRPQDLNTSFVTSPEWKYQNHILLKAYPELEKRYQALSKEYEKLKAEKGDTAKVKKYNQIEKIVKG